MPIMLTSGASKNLHCNKLKTLYHSYLFTESFPDTRIDAPQSVQVSHRLYHVPHRQIMLVAPSFKNLQREIKTMSLLSHFRTATERSFSFVPFVSSHEFILRQEGLPGERQLPAFKLVKGRGFPCAVRSK